MKTLTVLIFSIVAAACASGPCPHEKSSEPVTPQSASSASAPEPAKIRIFKADGSTQCSQKKGIDLKVTEAELTKAGVKVLSSAKQPDGMMHTQVCGAATGMANSFEVAPSDLKKAEKLGFKRWEN